MFDYKQLEALEMIVLAGSFDKAAGRLHLTQSAISQRIRQLEERFGNVLLIRENPVRPTPAGERLLAHVREVRRLEAELGPDGDHRPTWLPVRIGVNADSLAIGLLSALAPVAQQEQLLLECVVDDEAWTLGLLKAGEVVGCITTQADEIPGCSVTALGSMEYLIAASPDFAARWFANGLEQASLRNAPAAVSGKADSLHRRWLREHFQLEEGHYPCHIIADSHALLDAALAGIAYAIIPRKQAETALNQGTLIELISTNPIQVALFWQRQSRSSVSIEKISMAIRQFAYNYLQS